MEMEQIESWVEGNLETASLLSDFEEELGVNERNAPSSSATHNWTKQFWARQNIVTCKSAHAYLMVKLQINSKMPIMPFQVHLAEHCFIILFIFLFTEAGRSCSEY